MKASLFGVRNVEQLHGSSDADITKPALLFQAIWVGYRALMREQSVLHAAHEHKRKLKTLGRMHGHKLHAIFPGVGLALARLERGM